MQNIGETRQKFPLSKKKIIKKTITSLIGWFILCFIVFGFFWVTFSIPSPTGAATVNPITSGVLVTVLILLVVIGIITYIYQQMYFKVYFYDLTPDYVIIKKGVIAPREITVPYERIQDVYVDQDIFDRMFGLYDVHISSATFASGMLAHIDGVEKPAADGLRALLLQTVSAKIGTKSQQPVLNVMPQSQTNAK